MSGRKNKRVCKWAGCNKKLTTKSAFCVEHRKEVNKGRYRTPKRGLKLPTLDQLDDDQGSR